MQTIESDGLSVMRQGNWLSQNASRASGGSYLYSSGSSDDNLTLYFSGSSIEIIYVTHPSFGTLAIEIDNTVVRTLFTNADRANYDQRTVINALAEGPHILEVYAVQGVVAVDAFVTRPLQTNTPDTVSTQSSVMFIPNEGQYEPQVQFEADGMGLVARYGSNRANFFIPVRPNAAEDRGARVERQEIPFSQVFQGASPTAVVTGINRQPGVVNYLVGSNPAEWHTDIPIYGGIVYQNLYPNIDLYFTEATGLTNGEFILKPGADISNIRWQYEGISSLRLDAKTGQLTFEIANPNNLDVPLLPQRLTMRAWQLSNGQPQTVTIDYVLNTDGSVGLSANDYDITRSLTMQASVGEDEMGTAAASIAFPDLASFSYSTYVSGSGAEEVNDIAVDAEGNTYVVGYFSQNLRKYDANGVLVYASVVGGAFLSSVVVDDTGRAYVAGSTGVASLYTSPNAYQSSVSNCIDNPCSEVVVAVLSAAGNNIEYGTYLGGNRSEDAYGIAIQDGRIYLTGYTTSFDFDVTGQQGIRGGKDAFIAKLNPALSGTTQLEFGFTFGGRGGDWDDFWVEDFEDYGTGIAVDVAGNVYIGGYTETPDFWASESGVYQSTCVLYTTAQDPNLNDGIPKSRCISGFITKFRPVTGSTSLEVQASTFFGGDGDDVINGIAVDTQGYVYVVGTTDSANQLFNISNGYDSSFNGGSNWYPTGNLRPEAGDAFLAKFAPNLQAQDLVYATYLGGSSDESGYGIAVNAGGIATITGFTGSTDFPLSSNPLQTGLLGNRDVFLTRLDTTTSGSTSLLYSTFIGGRGGEVGYSVATDNNFAFYVAGETDSDNFPVVNPSQANYGGGGWDGFAFKAQQSCEANEVEITTAYFRMVALPPNEVSQDLPSWAMAPDAISISPVGDSIGLYVYEAPALNAAPLTPLTQLSWQAVKYCITGRFQYQNGGTQIWYRVRLDDSANTVGWILGHIGSHDYVRTPTDANIVTQLATIATSQTPALQLDPPETILFPYHRERTAEYAIVRSLENIANPPHIFDDPQTPGENEEQPRVTHDPLFPEYPELTGEHDATGSAMFISQSLWTGGLPMVDQAVAIDCASDRIEGSDGGWRYCPSGESRAGTLNWNYHEGIIQYIHTFKTGTSVQNWSHITLITAFRTEYVDADFSSNNPKVDTAIAIIENTNDEEFTRSQPHIGTLKTVQAGDYLFIDSGSGGTDNHGFIVVGWGRVQICSNLVTVPLKTAYPGYSGTLYVPYVADYSYGIPEGSDTPSWTQYPGPRPFYCLQVPTPTPGLLFGFTNYFFYQAPSAVQFSPSPAVLNTDRLYAPDFELLNQN